MSLPTLKEILTKFEIMNKMIKHESTTKAYVYMKVNTQNKVSHKLKNNRFKLRHAPYSNRWASLKSQVKYRKYLTYYKNDLSL